MTDMEWWQRLKDKAETDARAGRVTPEFARDTAAMCERAIARSSVRRLSMPSGLGEEDIDDE